MLCPKCGNQINKDESFCAECGTAVQNIVNDENHSKVQSKSTTLLASIKQYSNKGVNFISNHKKIFTLIASFCIIFSISIILFHTFYDPTKLAWDKENGDANVVYTQSKILTLNVLAYDKEDNPITDIKFSTKDGEIESDGSKVVWTLPSEEGKYTITAQTPSGKKIKKSVTVTQYYQKEVLNGVYEITEDEALDSDNDGLTDIEEKKLGTNPISADTDGDGLMDSYEINVSKTDPLKADTDGDGIQDGDELDLGLDPLKADSKGDGIKDSDRNLIYTVEDAKLGVTIEIHGKGNIASTTIDTFENPTLSNMSGLLNSVYNFYSNGTIEKAIVKINYDSNEIVKEGLDENNLTLYYFNEETKELEKMPTTIDIQNKQITAELKHFSKYVVGDNKLVSTKMNSQILFVIDNSVSMYSLAQMTEAGYSASTGAIGNDTTFKRLILTNKMIDMFTGNYQFGVAEFSGNYVSLKKFTNDKSVVKNSVNSMRSNWKSNGDGTNIITALKRGIQEFSSDNQSHYMILLTDGKNTEGSLTSNKNAIISSAKAKNVKICVIGLGTDLDTKDLNEIAETTGCDYYNASNSSALDEIYSLVGADINYNYVDTDNNSEVDGMIIADSGFIVSRDGFSFRNFKSNKSQIGHCYGMATFAMLYYKNELPLKLDAINTSKFQLLNFGVTHMDSNGYNLNNTYFSEGKDLYSFEITTPALHYFLYNDIPSDYLEVVDNTLVVSKKYKDQLISIGTTFEKLDANGSDYQYREKATLNIDNDIFNKGVSNDEAQLMNAIWRLFILQVGDKSITFGSTPDETFKALTTDLNNGTPIVISFNVDLTSGHAVNAIRLVQDINDANKFKLEIYDNNYPGETRYIDVTRTKYSKFAIDFTAWTNEYNYTFKYDTDNDGTLEDITVQLAYSDVNYKG